MLESVLLLFLQATRILPILGFAAVGFLVAPLFKRSRMSMALYAALAVVVFDDLYFTSIGGSPWRWAVLLPLAAIALAPYFVVPLRMLRKPVPMPSAPEPYDPARHKLPPLGKQFSDLSITALREQGFMVVDDVAVTLVETRVARFVILDHASEALRIQLRTEPAGSKLSGAPGHTSLFSVLPDGRWAVATNEQPRLAAGIPDPQTMLLRLIDALHPLVLLDACRKWVVTLPGADRRALPPGASMAEFADVNRRRYHERMIALGWYHETPRGLRHTVKGAFMSTWSLLFPLRQLRTFAAFREQERLLKELGVRIEKRPPRPTDRQLWLSFGTLNVARAAALLAFGFVWPVLADRGGFEGLVSPSLAAVRSDSIVPERLPDGFSVPADFPGAVRALERLAGASARPLHVDDGLSGTESKDIVMVPMDSARVDRLLAAAQPVFGARGFVLFHTQEMDGMHGEPHALALYPSRDPFSLVVAMNTNGANYGIEPEQIAAWLRETDRDHPLVLTSVGFDFVEGRFRAPLSAADANALAARVSRFCPDVVTQGTGSVAALAREMRKRRTLYCWWD
jgi:hypothetical protein